MREILFRGKRKDNGEWWYGLPCRTLNKDGEDVLNIQCWERDEEGVTGIYEPVIPETVGQYTGKMDKNGTKIFEGDVVYVKIKGYNTICKVAWAENVAQFQLWQFNTIPNTPTALNLGNYDCEVIGNIHDNPELIRSENSGKF